MNKLFSGHPFLIVVIIPLLCDPLEYINCSLPFLLQFFYYPVIHEWEQEEEEELAYTVHNRLIITNPYFVSKLYIKSEPHLLTNI